MAYSETLQRAYASAPADTILLTTIEFEGYDLRFVQNYEDMPFGGVLYEACAMSVTLPNKSTSLNQTLRISFGAVDDRAQAVVDAVRESGQPLVMLCKEWFATNPNYPTKKPVRMQVLGGGFDDTQGILQVEASYFDVLNSKWPREIYTVHNAPGMKWQ